MRAFAGLGEGKGDLAVSVSELAEELRKRSEDAAGSQGPAIIAYSLPRYLAVVTA